MTEISFLKQIILFVLKGGLKLQIRLRNRFDLSEGVAVRNLLSRYRGDMEELLKTEDVDVSVQDVNEDDIRE